MRRIILKREYKKYSRIIPVDCILDSPDIDFVVAVDNAAVDIDNHRQVDKEDVEPAEIVLVEADIEGEELLELEVVVRNIAVEADIDQSEDKVAVDIVRQKADKPNLDKAVVVLGRLRSELMAVELIEQAEKLELQALQQSKLL